MASREFADQEALIDYAERNDLVYLWEGTPSFAARQRQLSLHQYEVVHIGTNRGVRRAMLFSKAILKSEWKRPAPIL